MAKGQDNMSDEERKEYVAWILENDGVQLDPSKIQKNKAMKETTNKKWTPKWLWWTGSTYKSLIGEEEKLNW
ncbi:unnamed protein product [Caenorhabditis nigoni]